MSATREVDGLQVDALDVSQTAEAAKVFHRDGFVVLKGVLSPEQVKFMSGGVDRVIAEQTGADPERKGNRGHHRYSFGNRVMHPEWAMLCDLPGVLGMIDAIWGSKDYTCTGAGGDYSLPTAEIQPLHQDMGDFYNDPWREVTFQDGPTGFIVVNFLATPFNRVNGAIRFVPCTHRSRAPVPTLEEEPTWMRNNIICGEPGDAIVRDVRCWHGGTANNSTKPRVMTSAGYMAPWRRAIEHSELPRALYDKMSERGQQLCRLIVGK